MRLVKYYHWAQNEVKEMRLLTVMDLLYLIEFVPPH